MAADSIDLSILEYLSAHGRAPNHEVGEHVGLSPSAVCRRIQALEQTGIIRGYRAVIDEHALGRGTTVFLRVTLDSQAGSYLEAFEKAIARCPNVQSCYLMAGQFDYLLRVSVADTADFERMHREHLSRLPGLARIESMFTVREVSCTGTPQG